MNYYLDTNFLDIYQKTLDRISQAYQRIFQPITKSMRINQKVFDCLNSSIEKATRTFFQNFYATNEGLFTSCVNQLQSMNVLSPTCTKAINNLSSITTPLAEALRSIDFDSLLESLQSNNDIENHDDYIITDSHVIREIDLSDGFVIPTGDNRLKIKTDTFIALLSFLFTIFAFIFNNMSNKSSQEDARLLLELNLSLQKQVQLEKEQALLDREQNRHFQEIVQLDRAQSMFLWEQNLILLEILESLDASESSQADFIRDMKESLQEQASLFQMPLESAVAVQESAVAVQESLDSTQKADNPSQSIADTSPPTPSTGYDNE